MRIVFVCSDCNIGFVSDELIYYLNSSDITEVVVFTDKAILAAGVSEHNRSKVYIMPEYRFKPGIWSFPRVMGKIGKLAFSEWLLNWKLYGSWSKVWSMISELRNEVRKLEIMKRECSFSDAVCLSYWASNDALTISMLAMERDDLCVMTRIHGYDLYEEFAPKGRIPFRWFLLKHMQRFIAISEDGRNYFVKKYPRLAHRTDMFHLGTKDRNVAIQPAPADVIRVVTCGSATPNKRHMEVFQVLNQMQGVEWYHIGAGDLFDELREKVQKEAKIPVKLLGHLSQDEIYALYATTPFTCFLSLSVTEGLPVSMMEAISCGIPLVSTDVGGCREIAVPETGYLLSQHYTEAEVMERIRDCANGPLAGMEGRKDIYAFWKQNFEADTNYGKFLSYLKQFIRK